MSLTVVPCEKPLQGEDIYDFASDKRGLCFIVNNINYHEVSRNRRGAKIDEMNMQTVFEQLGFTVEIETDLTAYNLKTSLQNVAQYKVQADHEALVIIILSHGNQGCISGVDDETTTIDEVIDCFSNENCKQLIDKPKMFFIQACRGDSFDYGVDTFRMPIQFDAHPWPTEIKNNDIIPHFTDILVCYATIDGYVSIRDVQQGSWFITHLAETICKEAHFKELNELLMNACKLVNDMETTLHNRKVKQTMEWHYKGWRKKFYFNPNPQN